MCAEFSDAPYTVSFSTHTRPAMPTPSQQAVAEALAALLHEVLREDGAADVPGLGRFERAHQPSSVAQREGDGRTVIVPPRDIVALVASPAPEGRA